MCKCLKLLCESKLVNVLCGKMTSNGLVSGKVSFYPRKDERKKILQPWEPSTGRDTINPPFLKAINQQ